MKDPKDTNTPRPEDSGGEEPILRDERLTAYLFGELQELTPDEREAIAREIESSGSRRDELDLLRKTVEAVRAAAPRAGALDPGRREALLRAAGEERPAGAASGRPASRPATGKIWLFLTPVAAAAAVLLVLWPLLNGVSTPGDGTELADATEVGESEGEKVGKAESAFRKSRDNLEKAPAPSDAASAPGEHQVRLAAEDQLAVDAGLAGRGAAAEAAEAGAEAARPGAGATGAHPRRAGEPVSGAESSKAAGRDRDLARGSLPDPPDRPQSLELAARAPVEEEAEMRSRSVEQLSEARRVRRSSEGDVVERLADSRGEAPGVTAESLRKLEREELRQRLDQGSLVREGGSVPEEDGAAAELPEVRLAEREREERLLREALSERNAARDLEELRKTVKDESENEALSRERRALRFAREDVKRARAPESRVESAPSPTTEAPEGAVATESEPAAEEPVSAGRPGVTDFERDGEEAMALGKKVDELAAKAKTRADKTDTPEVENFAEKTLDALERQEEKLEELAAAGDTAAAGEKGKEASDLAAAKPTTSTRGRASSRTTIDPRVAVDDILSRLDRREGETPDMMFFRYFGDNPFADTRNDPLSTFGVDVDTASYTLFRSYIYKQGVLPPKAAIRTEEFVNYFETGYEPPSDGADFAIQSEVAPTPFAHRPEYRLLKVGVKAREVERAERKPCALTFVIDTSGSMRRENRLELVKDALGLLVPELDEGDHVGIVAFDRETRRILEPTPASERETILDAIDSLHPRRNTNVDAGLREGYSMASANLVPDANNRVILLSDGVANTGVTDARRMLERTSEHRRRGIFLSCIGVGMGNHNDALLEELADNGDGQCIYVDRIEEARRAFVENLTATLEAVARDARVQVEFDPEKVSRYRLLGYENRDIADHRFRDKTVDAGEVGAGHEVVALYEIRPAAEETEGPLATVRLRYKAIENDEEIELEHAVEGSTYESFEEAPARYRLSALVAEFAEVLRESYWARGQSLDRVASLTEELLGEGEGKLGMDPDVVELVALMKKADALARRREAERSEEEEVVAALKENLYLEARIEEASEERRAEDRRHIQELREQNAALRERLEGLLVR